MRALQAWYDVIGVGGNVFAQDYDNKYLGQYYGPTGGYPSDITLSAASAFVRDNFVPQTNYAFQVAFAPVPEPETYALMLVGLGVLGYVARRRKGAGGGARLGDDLDGALVEPARG